MTGPILIERARGDGRAEHVKAPARGARLLDEAFLQASLGGVGLAALGGGSWLLAFPSGALAAAEPLAHYFVCGLLVGAGAALLALLWSWR